ncbi:MAG TPA: hypothetical protein VNJ31_09960 [Methyloceanibacter sp.]|nr:hypothetical protein [Methyloceanibacter sp.]
MPLPGLIAVAFLAASVAIPLCAAFAEPLDQAACADLEAERKKLLTPKMKAALEQGPDWVKDHLNAADIEQVRAFLVVEEKLEFRCRGINVVAKALKEASTNPDGVPLPDRKPSLPQSTAESADEAVRSTASTADPEMPLPDRKPGAADSASATAQASQAVADSAKTTPSKTKATR